VHPNFKSVWQYKSTCEEHQYVPTHEPLNHRLAAWDVKYSKALQGTMIFFLINANVGDDDWASDFFCKFW